jgi:hypothetical protein
MSIGVQRFFHPDESAPGAADSFLIHYRLPFHHRAPDDGASGDVYSRLICI